MSLYIDKGYLNTEWIAEQAEKNRISFIVMIGGRQVGKTYGTLKFMLDKDLMFILMRRTSTEVDFICSDINNPFVKYSRAITVSRDSKYTAAIKDDLEDRQIGTVMSLSTIAKIRGFSGDVYSDLVFDEFIPENHVTRIKDEGDAFLNALVTVSGNRELEGRAPLRVWLLANANTINSPILASLSIQEKVVQMRKEGQELSIMRDRGIMIVLPSSFDLMQKRRGTALMKAIDLKSKFAGMALQNEFSYNDASNLRNVRFTEYKPIFAVRDQFVFYQHKSRPEFYVSRFKNCGDIYENTERERDKARGRFPDMRGWYVDGRVWFDSLVTKTNFVNFVYNKV